MIALDTNVLIRLLTNDDPRQSVKAEDWLRDNASTQRPAYVDQIVLVELSWVLERSYGYSAGLVREAIQALLDHPSIKVEGGEIVRQALAWQEKGSADFADYLLAARAEVAGYAPVLTFDKKAARTTTHRLLA